MQQRASVLLLSFIITSIDAFQGTGTRPAWRVVLDINNDGGLLSGEQGSLPLVVPCDFLDDGTTKPRSPTVKFTASGGEVVKPIEGGFWNIQDNRNLEFCLRFPEKVTRNDIVIDAGTTITLKSLIYTVDDLDQLNNNFYEARALEWKARDRVDEIYSDRDGPKKWDEASKSWVREYHQEPLMSALEKQMSLLSAGLARQKEEKKRPQPRDLSTYPGLFPGIESGAYLVVNGDITIKKGWLGDAKIGSWSAEPILETQQLRVRDSSIN